jgi:hypothetical protein
MVLSSHERLEDMQKSLVGSVHRCIRGYIHLYRDGSACERSMTCVWMLSDSHVICRG